MIKRILLENFMAHQAASLELAPGVTVISGPNNIGKSAIVEAIRYLVYNPAPKNVIRHGAKKALVSLELDSGEIITWQRQDKSASYRIEQPGQDPEEYHKFGREVPHDVRSLLRLEQVKTDTDDIDIHLGNQRQPIFLLDRPGSHAAAFFAASTEADFLLKMQQALKRRIDLAKAARKALEAELEAVARQLSGYEPLDDLETRLNQAEARHTEILETARQLPLLEEIGRELLATQGQLRGEEQAAAILGFLENPPALEDTADLALLLAELADKTRQRQRETGRAASLATLAAPPVLETTTELEAVVRQMTDTHSTYAATTRQAQVLAVLNPPPALAEVATLQALAANYDDTRQHLASRRQRQGALAAAAEPPHLEDTTSLEDLWRHWHREQSRYEEVTRTAALLAELESPPEIDDLHDLELCRHSLKQAAAELSRLQVHLAALTGQLDGKQTEIQTFLQDTGACPLCGSPLDLKHFLENRHG